MIFTPIFKAFKHRISAVFVSFLQKLRDFLLCQLVQPSKYRSLACKQRKSVVIFFIYRPNYIVETAVGKVARLFQSQIFYTDSVERASCRYVDSINRVCNFSDIKAVFKYATAAQLTYKCA